MATELLLRGYHSSLQEGSERGDDISPKRTSPVTGTQAANWAEGAEALPPPVQQGRDSPAAAELVDKADPASGVSLPAAPAHLGVIRVQSVTMAWAGLCLYSCVPSELLQCCLQSLSLRLSLRQWKY